MNETQRQAYLQAMGIQQYFPRSPVPGAKPSPVYAVRIPAPPSAPALRPVEVPAGVQAPVAVVAKPARRRVSAAERADKHEVAPAVAVTATPTAAEPVDELHFRLHYIRISDSLAIIDEVPYQHENKASTPARALLKAIMRAVGADYQADAMQVDTFSWPLLPGMSSQGNAAVDAQNALQGFIAMRQETDGFQHLVVFAAQISDMLMQEKSDTDRDRLSDNGTYHITITHSLHSMLAHPILKRETWAHLQQLRQRLAATAV